MFDLTSLWAAVQKNKRRINQLLIAVLVFVGGWLLGHITSPYYAAQPIVFIDREPTGSAASAGGSAQQLEVLRDEGIASRPTVAPSQVAGASNEAGEKQFVASVNSTLFHHVSCAAAKSIKEENQVWFATSAQAQAAGYSPSKCTIDKGIK